MKRLWLLTFIALIFAHEARAQVLSGGGGSLVGGSTPIVGGTNGYCAYDNAGVLGFEVCGTATPAGASGQIQYNNSSAFAGSYLWQRTNSISQVNSTNAQQFIVYETSDNTGPATTNYAYAFLDAGVTAANTVTLGAAQGGTGSLGKMQFTVGGVDVADYAVSTANQWTISKPTAFGSSLKVQTRVVSASTDTATTADYFLCVTYTSTGAVTETLPTGATGLTLLIKDCGGLAGTNAITITPAAGNIDGAATYSLNTNYGSVAVTYVNGSWSIN